MSTRRLAFLYIFANLLNPRLGRLLRSHLGRLACFLLRSVSSKNVKKADARVGVCVAGKGGDCADGGGDGGGFNSLLR